jgi:hypothetical protein
VQTVTTRTVGSSTYTFTTTEPLAPTASPRGTPTSISTGVYSYEQLTIVYLYYPPGAVDSADIVTTTTDNYSATANDYTYYVESVVYTAPTSCPTAFTVATVTEINIPTAAASLITPTATSSTLSTNRYGDVYTVISYYIAPSAAPAVTGTDNFYYSYYIKNCRNPTATGAAYWGPSISGTGSSSADDSEVCSLLTGCTSFRTWMIVIATVLPSLFVLGFLESFLWYRRLMIGKGCLRFGTVCWILISIWVICFTRKQEARSADDQVALKQQWDNMTAGDKWKNWWRWGFRHAYPVKLLGEPTPPRRVAPMSTVQQVQRPQPVAQSQVPRRQEGGQLPGQQPANENPLITGM